MNAFHRLLSVFLLIVVCCYLNAQQSWPLKEWPVATPQSQSMNADSLKAFDDLLAIGKYGYIDAMIVTRKIGRAHV